jgi:DNA mismatch repair protein MutS
MCTSILASQNEIKAKYGKEVIILSLCGDFYEAYEDDAETIARLLGITLTRRSENGDSRKGIRMAGFPRHALDTYLPKLIRAGHRVAITELVVKEVVAPGIAL